MSARPGVTAAASTGAGFAVTVPPSWIELDLAPATRDGAVAAMVEQRVRDVPDLREHRSTIARLLRDQAREAWDAGARFCACMVEPSEDGPITASVTVSVVRGPLGVRPGSDAQRAALLAPLTAKEAAHEDDTWQRVEPVQMAGGMSGARAWGLEDLDLPGDRGWVRAVQLLQLVPVPGESTVVLLACSSPVVALAGVLLDLFAAVADTLTVVVAPPPVLSGASA